MIPIAQLLTAPTSTQIRAQMVSALQALGIPAAQWIQGGTASTILTIVANTFAMFATLLTSAVGAGFLTVASGPWLVLLAYYVYGVTANPATFATGPLQLTNGGGGDYNFGPGQAMFQNSESGIFYTNLSTIALGPGQVQTIQLQATTAGSVGSSPPGAGAGTVDTLTTAMAGVTILVPSAIVGTDADPDPLVRQKCLAAIAGRSYKGPEGAYENAVFSSTNTVTGNAVNINRVVAVLDPDTDLITVYVASPAGPAAATDVAGCQNNVTALAEPMGITSTVVSAAGIPFSGPITVWARGAGSTTTPATIQSEVVAALIAYAAAYPIGGLAKPPSTQGYLWASGLDGVIKGADPLIFAIDGLTSDTPLNAGQVPVITAAIANSITVRQVP